MEKVILNNVNINGDLFEKLYVFIDDEGKVIFLPLLWLIHLCKTDSVFAWRTLSGESYNLDTKKSPIEIFEAKTISENTQINYVGHVYKFLEFINEQHKSKKSPSVHYIHEVNTSFINEYLNKVLAKTINSPNTLSAHKSGLSSFFSFLFDLRIKDRLHPSIPRKTIQEIAAEDEREKKINYISKSDRNALIRACNSKRDRLIIRMGAEVGLRAKENTGISLENTSNKSNAKNGLLGLFDQMDKYQVKMSFEYHLNGKYTKGNKTRLIYFDRGLLSDLRDYYNTERQVIMERSGKSCNTLFVRNDPHGRGLPISKKIASRIFTKYRIKFEHMNTTLSYHDLRHTFATELYHQELKDKSGHETRSESAALLVVRQRLGHSSIKSTEHYIRLRNQMLAIEGAQ